MPRTFPHREMGHYPLSSDYGDWRRSELRFFAAPERVYRPRRKPRQENRCRFHKVVSGSDESLGCCWKAEASQPAAPPNTQNNLPCLMKIQIECHVIREVKALSVLSPLSSLDVTTKRETRFRLLH